MSVVSGITLQCSCCEDEAAVVEMLKAACACRWQDLAEHACGNKHPQTMVFCAGINSLDEDLFAAAVMAYAWDNPENVVLIIEPEEGSTRVWRPSTTPIELFVARDALVHPPASETEPEYLKGLDRFLDRARVMLAPIPDQVLGPREAFVHRLALMLADLERGGSRDVRIKSAGPFGVELLWSEPVPRE